METNEFSRSNMLLNSKDENLKFRISSGIILYKGNYIPRITASWWLILVVWSRPQGIQKSPTRRPTMEEEAGSALTDVG